MSPLTAKNIYRHELIGLDVIVENAYHTKVKGTVVNETRNMITISDGTKDRHVVKRLIKLYLRLPDNKTVIVDGRKIIGRPEDRIKIRRR